MRLPHNVTEDDVEKFVGIVKTVISAITLLDEDNNVIGTIHGEHVEEIESFIVKWEGKK